MDSVADFFWNPSLSLIYLEVGALFLLLTGCIAWRGIPRTFRYLLKAKQQAGHERLIPEKHAFITAIVASAGVGNLAGVATAIHMGGPGALFWMWVSALLGMSFRMASTYFALLHNPKDPASPLFATPMVYLEKCLGRSWRWVALLLAGLLMTKGLLTANLIQTNSVAHALENSNGPSHIIVALLMAGAVAAVIIGGIRSIIKVCVLIAPWMLLLYIGAGLLILLSDPGRTLDALMEVFRYAFTPYSAVGGAIGYTVMQSMQFGVSRGVFSHGSGMGVAPFLQAAHTASPGQGAFLAAIVPLIDTLVICTITGLIVISTGLWGDFNGAYLTAQSFEWSLGVTGKICIIMALVSFSFTTIINWAYYSERCFTYLGGKNLAGYRWFFVAVTFIGPFFPVEMVWFAGDALIAIILLTHLTPLTYITIRHISSFVRGLRDAL